jgi:hypothetical protein
MGSTCTARTIAGTAANNPAATIITEGSVIMSQSVGLTSYSNVV